MTDEAADETADEAGDEAGGQEAVRWASRQLDQPVEAELLRARPWSVTWLLRTPRRTAFLKATGPSSHYEVPLLDRLSALPGSFVPDVLASHDARGWVLMANAGPTLFTRTARRTQQQDGGWDAGAWQSLLARFAELQRAAEPIAEDLISAGVPDERPHRLAGALAGLLRDSPNLAGLTAGEREAAAGLAPSWSADLATLEQAAIPASVQHGDLHDNNVSTGADGRPRFFDFGDASIAHPFTTFLVPLRIATSRGAPAEDLGLLRRAYLTPFAGLAPMPELQDVLDAALRLAWVPRATSWDRALTAAPAGHEWGEPVTEIVRELLASRGADPGQATDSSPS